MIVEYKDAKQQVMAFVDLGEGDVFVCGPSAPLIKVSANQAFCTTSNRLVKFDLRHGVTRVNARLVVEE